MTNANEALERLKLGHQNFVEKLPIPAPSEELLRDLATDGQHPFAVVVTCSDSRVVPEFIFHAQPGDIFTIRTAGQVISNIEMGSIEYAVDHLGTRLVVVLGHTHCGAVHGACEPHEHCSCNLGALLSLVEPSVNASRAQCCSDKELVAVAEDLNIKNMVEAIAANPMLDAIEDLKIVGAKYDIDKGQIVYWI